MTWLYMVYVWEGEVAAIRVVKKKLILLCWSFTTIIISFLHRTRLGSRRSDLFSCVMVVVSVVYFAGALTSRGAI